MREKTKEHTLHLFTNALRGRALACVFVGKTYMNAGNKRQARQFFKIAERFFIKMENQAKVEEIRSYLSKLNEK